MLDAYGVGKHAMKCALLLLLLSSVQALDVDNDINPVETVIKFLKKAQDKALAEKQEEEAAFAAYSEFCHITIPTKTEAIHESNVSIDLHNSNAEGWGARARTMQGEIDVHNLDIAAWKDQANQSMMVRERARKAYDDLLLDYTQSCDALKAAIGTLKQQDHVTKGITTEAMMQSNEMAFHSELLQTQSTLSRLSILHSHSKVDEAMRSIDSYLMQHDSQREHPNPGDKAQDAQHEHLKPSTNASDEVQGKEGQKAYVFQSEAIVELLNTMRADFSKEREDLQETEVTARRDYQATMMELTNQINFATESVQTKKGDRDRFLKEQANELQLVKETEAMRDADTQYLNEVTTTCDTKTQQFTERNRLRGDELTAMAQATEQIELVLANYSKHMKLLQMSSSTALAQLRRGSPAVLLDRVTEFLQMRGSSLNSRLLIAIASRTSATPLDKIMNMINDMISKLKDEAATETAHDDWCVNELKSSTDTRAQKSKHIADLKAQLEVEQAQSEKLREDIATDNATIARLSESMANATAQRNNESAENTEALQQAADGIKALALARTILMDFITKAQAAAEAAAAKASLLQMRSQRRTAVPDLPIAKPTVAGAPKIFDDKSYVGQTDFSNNILATLDVVDGDFARLKALTIKQEQESLDQYTAFMGVSNNEMDATVADKDFKTKAKQDTDNLILTNQNDLNGTTRELDAAEQYFLTLKASCISTGMSDADRVQKRGEEMQSLQEALEMLEAAR